MHTKSRWVTRVGPTLDLSTQTIYVVAGTALLEAPIHSSTGSPLDRVGRECPARFGMSLPCTHLDENGQPTCSVVPNVCMEGDFATISEDPWKVFHSALGGGTDGGIFHGRFQCGCARGQNMSALTELTENALYVSDTGVKMSYVGELGWGGSPNPIRG